ncbi:hypothetical protein RHMOL_Rhmol12G0055600 [Rhododendron molle]|uniref:Uncharacterized protein n=1 Tax=Rhododendron molle TaxID=49168 RepID=A0ACC0LEK3_RHOML|nr:hypothetical protein RHMOL_Rhmol12G0055600 [Rhododendron molle]
MGILAWQAKDNFHSTGNELDCTSEETEVSTVVTHLIKQIQTVCCVAIIAVHVALKRATGDMAESAADIAEALDDEDVAANETGDGSTPQELAKKKGFLRTLLLDWVIFLTSLGCFLRGLMLS